MNDLDVTKFIKFDINDGEYLPIIRCICGKEFCLWDFSISIYKIEPDECKYCKRKFYFRNEIKIYQIIE